MAEQTLFNLNVKQGSTFRLTLLWKLEDSAGVRTPQSLAGYTAKMQIRPRVGSSTVLLTLTTVGETGYDADAYLALEADAETGRIDIYIGATATAALTESGVYDLELHLTGDPNEVVPLLGGAVILEKQVTQ